MNLTLYQKYQAVKGTLHFSCARVADHWEPLKWLISQDLFRLTKISGFNYKKPHPFQHRKASLKWFFGDNNGPS